MYVKYNTYIVEITIHKTPWEPLFPLTPILNAMARGTFRNCLIFKIEDEDVFLSHFNGNILAVNICM